MKLPKFRLRSPILKSLLRLYLAFAGLLLLFVVLFNNKIFYWHVNVPFTSFIVLASSFLINLFGGTSFVDGTHLSTAAFGINVVDGCNGIYATAILLAGILAYPAKWNHKLLGVLIGFAAIFVVNLLRVISLLYLGQYFPDLFKEIHIFVWQPIIIIWAIFVWYLWWSRIEGGRSRVQDRKAR